MFLNDTFANNAHIIKSYSFFNPHVFKFQVNADWPLRYLYFTVCINAIIIIIIIMFAKQTLIFHQSCLFLGGVKNEKQSNSDANRGVA